MSAVWNIMMTGISVGAVFGSLFYTSAFSLIVLYKYRFAYCSIQVLFRLLFYTSAVSLIVACSTPIRAILTSTHAILTLGVIMLEFFKTRSGMLVIKVL